MMFHGVGAGIEHARHRCVTLLRRYSVMVHLITLHSPYDRSFQSTINNDCKRGQVGNVSHTSDPGGCIRRIRRLQRI